MIIWNEVGGSFFGCFLHKITVVCAPRKRVVGPLAACVIPGTRSSKIRGKLPYLVFVYC